MVFKTVHGMTGTKPFHRWADMTKRCHAKYHHAYKYYGARGINVCNRWRNSFLDYYGDVGEPATPDLSIDRINNDGGYSMNNEQQTYVFKTNYHPKDILSRVFQDGREQ